MVPNQFHDFFVASTGASAALTGLLFVAISIAPERTFGERATGERFAYAGTAFTALVNILFISLAALIPATSTGALILAFASASLINIVLLMLDIWRRGLFPAPREWRRTARGVLLPVLSLGIYILEFWYALHLLRAPDDFEPLVNVLYLLLGAFAVGIARAWELLGGRDYSILWTLLGWRRDSSPPPDDER